MRWRGEGRAVRVELIGAPLPAVSSESDLMTRAFDNRIDNAFKYGATRVDLVLLLEGGGVSICVRDDGPGINDAQLISVRQPFHRGDAARGGPGGAGLGLAIVERIAAIGGASMELANRPEGGLQVMLTWPHSA